MTYARSTAKLPSNFYEHQDDVLVAGTPRLKIKMDPAYGEKCATYEGRPGPNTLNFAYTVVEPNIST